MKVSSVLVTPRMALRWLEKNVNNRAVRDQKALEFSEEMKRGKWRPDASLILLSKDGEVLDGQHRLWGVVFSEIPQRFIVRKDATRETQEVVDLGSRRQIHEILSISSGEFVPAKLVTAAHHFQTQPTTAKAFSWPPSVSREAVEKAKSVLWWANGPKTGNPSQKHGRALRAAVVAAIARASFYEDKEKLQEFRRQLEEGSTCSPIRLLRDWLLTTGDHHRSLDEREAYAKTQSAIQAYCLGQKMTKLYGWSKDLYPVPKHLKVEVQRRRFTTALKSKGLSARHRQAELLAATNGTHG